MINVHFSNHLVGQLDEINGQINDLNWTTTENSANEGRLYSEIGCICLVNDSKVLGLFDRLVTSIKG